MPMINTDGRHQATQDAARWLEPNPNLTGQARDTAIYCGELALRMLAKLPDSPELAHGLRRLLEAKDCFVRASLADDEAPQGWAALRP